MKLDNDAQYFMNLLHDLNTFFLVEIGCLFFLLVKSCANGQRNQLTSINFKIDMANAAVEPRKGTLAVSAMFLTVVATRVVYWMMFLKLGVVGMVGSLIGCRCGSGLIYIAGCVPGSISMIGIE
jgi:hypothetical protein